MKVFISTLGIFDVKLEDTSLIKDSSRSYKLFKLFKYFLTFKNTKILPDTIIENLWEDHDSYDPNNMLRAQIYRLRKLMKMPIPDGGDEKDYVSIDFINGYYLLNVGEKVTVDVDEFENLIKIGDSKSVSDVDESIIYYQKALDLYKGTYLEDSNYELWLVPIKNHYSRLYLKTLFKLLDILNEQGKYQNVIETCRKAIALESYDENIHIYLMEAMLKTGQVKDAESHYEYIVHLLDKNKLPITSSDLIDMGRKIQNHLIEKSKIDISDIKLKLEEKSDRGPLSCDFNYFKLLYNMQKKNRNIEEEPAYITLITLNEDLIEDELKEWTNIISKVLKNSLRGGDVFTFWNELQVLVLLQNVKDNGSDVIENRIKNNLQIFLEDESYNVNIESCPVMPQAVLT